MREFASFPLGLHTKTESIESSSFGNNIKYTQTPLGNIGKSSNSYTPLGNHKKKQKIIVSLLSKDKQVEVRIPSDSS